MRDAGKRMMDALIRLANDSLAYYMHDDIGRSLFQARRDAELSEAYDDHGISGGNKIASMIRNVENAIQILKERELEMLADRNALPQLEIIHQLMQELEVKLQERFKSFQTVEDSLVLANLMQDGTAVLAEGTNLSLGMINKYLRFTHMQTTPLSTSIQPEKVRSFILQMYDPPLESDVPNVYQLFSFMEQGQHEDEVIDGLWMPVKFAAPIGPEDIDEAVHFLETYEPISVPINDEEEEIEYTTDTISEKEMEEFLGETEWKLTKSMIETEAIESFLNEHDETPMEQLVIEATSTNWSDAVNAITAVAALVGNKKITVTKPNEKVEIPVYERKWEWMNRDDGSDIIKKRSRRDEQSE